MSFADNNFIELNVWYAIDKYGRVLEFWTSGFGNIPKFIYESEKNNKILDDYFGSKEITDLFKFSAKDSYIFDACAGEGDTTNYLLILSPRKPLLISDLSPEIASIISNNIFDIDVESVDSIIVDNTYGTRISLDDIVASIIKGKFYLNRKNEYFSINFKTKLKLKKLMKSFKKDSNTSFVKVKSNIEIEDQIEVSKQYYEITTSQEEFILYLIYKCDIIDYDNSKLYSLQISKKNEAVFDFNDKAGVWISSSALT